MTKEELIEVLNKLTSSDNIIYEQYFSTFRSFYNSLPGKVKIIDRNFNILKIPSLDFQEGAGSKCYEQEGHSEPCSVCLGKEVFKTGQSVSRFSTLEEEEISGVSYKYYCEPIKDENGIIIALLEFAVDVTDLRMMEQTYNETNIKLEEQAKRAEKKLAKTEFLLQQAQNAAGMGFWELYQATGQMLWSDGIYKLLEHTENKKEPSLDSFLQSFPENLRENIKAAFKNPENFPKDGLKLKFASKSGEASRYLLKIAHPETQKNTSVISGTLQDISVTDSYDGYDKYECLTSSLFRLSNVALCIADSEARILKSNKAFADMLDYTQEKMNTLIEEDIFFPRSLERFRLLTAGPADETGTMKLKARKNGGEKLHLLASCSGVSLSGEKSLCLVSLINVSKVRTLKKKQKRQEAMLIQQSKMAAMGEMLGVIAHQWKQPLNSLAITAQNIGDDFDHKDLTEERVKEYIEIILSQVDFMSSTVDDFRTFFMPEKQPVQFFVCKAVQEIVLILQPQLKACNVVTKLTSVCSDNGNSPKVTGFPNEVKQVVLNLITNSKDAIMERRKNDKSFETTQGLISIDITETSEHINIRIEDNGGGISEKGLKNLFRPYFTTKEANGTGIGLYLCKTIITDKMNGKITAENSKNGAVFTISLLKSI
jgi:nitrogen-specific signal transduction histidine kinase